jgi:lysozyme family protein
MAALTANQRRRYELLYESCLTRPSRKASVSSLASKITANRKRY